MRPPEPPSTIAEGQNLEEAEPADARLPPSGFELRLADGRAYILGAGRPLARGVVARRFRMEVPRIRFPFDLTGGADRFRDQRCVLRELEIAVDAAALARWVAQAVDLSSLCQGPLEVAARPGFLELSGQHPLAGPYTAKLAVEIAAVPDDRPRTEQSLGAFLYDFRLYQPSELSAAEILHSFAARLRPPAQAQPLDSGRQVAVEVLSPALRQLLVPRGFRIPETTGVGLRRIEILTGQLVLTFEESDLPAEAPPAAELLAREGQRAFGEVEAAIAGGHLERARSGLRDLSQVEAHPFAAERLLQLLAAEPASHDLALDLCALLRRRSPVPPVALWVEAALREELGKELGGAPESLRAAQAFLELAETSLAERGLFSAAVAARRAAELALRGGDPALANRAYALWESAVPNDVDALMGLADLAEKTGDIATAIGALRRVAAFADDGLASARAHGRLGKLLLDRPENVARARLHLDQALRQNPKDLASLLALTDSCERSGEWVRAVRLEDRAAELAHERGDLRLATELFAKSAATWEAQLGRPENALLRLRDALAHQPEDPARRALLVSIARVSNALGLRSEALAAQREVARLSPAGRPRAEAYLSESRLLSQLPDSQAAAQLACASALEQDPTYREAAEELVRLCRSGPAAPLREALTKAADLSEPIARADYLIERGDLELADSSAGVTAARQSFALALEAVPDRPDALARFASAAELQGDHLAAAEAVARLAAQATTPEERAERLRRLADLASWIAEPETAARLLEPAAAHADAPLPLLLRLLDVERSRVPASAGAPEGEPSTGGEAQLQLALRIADVAELAGQPELARSVLVDQLDRVERPEQVAAARPLLERALALDPGSVEVHEANIRLARLAGDPAWLRAALRSSLDLAAGDAAPRRLEIWRELAELSLAAGLRADAIAGYEAMRSLNPDDLGAARQLVELHAAEGRPERQAEALDELSNLLWRKGDRTGAADSLVDLAALVCKEDRPRAAETLRRAVALGPSTEVLEKVAGLAESLGEAALATEVLVARAQVLTAPRARALALRRAALIAPAGAQALDLGLRAHTEDPSFAWGQLLAASVALEDGVARRALDLAAAAWAAPDPGAFSDGLSDGPADELSGTERELAEALAVAAAHSLDDAGSEDLWLSRLEHRDPGELEYPRRRLLLQHALIDRQPGANAFQAQAIESIAERVAERLSAREAADAWIDLGQLRMQGGDSQAAAAAFRKALERVSDDGPALLGLVRSLAFEHGEHPERARWRRQLLKQIEISGNAELLFGDRPSNELGQLVAEEARSLSAQNPGGREAAVRAWARASELLPGDPEPPRELARLWREAGDFQRSADAELELSRRLPREQRAERGAAVLGAIGSLRRIGAHAAAIAAAEAGLTGDLPKASAAAIWVQLAELRAQVGDASGELVALGEAAAAATPAERSAFHLRRADLFQARGEREAERTALTLALPGREHDLELLGRLRAASEALGDDEAIADTLEVTAQALLHRGDPQAAAAATYELGQFVREKLQKPRRAEAAFRRVLELAPDHLEARRGLAELLIGHGDAESVGRGLDLLVAGLALEPAATRAAATLSLAERSASMLDRPDIALKLLRRLRASGSAAPGGVATLDLQAAALGAQLLYAQGATEEALTWLADAQSQLGPASDGDSVETRNLRRGYQLRAAELLADLGRDREALAVLLDLCAGPLVPDAAVDQLRGLLGRDLGGGEAPGPVDLAESVFAVARQIRSATRARALLDAEVRRLQRDGASVAAIAESLERQCRLATDSRHRLLFQTSLARLRGPEALAALVRALPSDTLSAGRQLADIGQALQTLGEPAAAAEVLDCAAAQLLEAGEREPAVGVLRQALALDRSADRILRLADLLQGSGGLADSAPEQPGEAAGLDAELCALGSAPLPVLERQADRLRHGEDVAGLASFLEAHAAEFPSPDGCLLEAAALRRSLDDLQAAQEDLRSAFATAPASPRPFAALLARTSAEELPELLLRRAAAVASEAPALTRVAAEMLLQEGRLRQAADVLDEVLRGPARNVDSLAWAVRLEVAAAQHQPLDPWLPGLDRALLEGLGGAGVLGESVPRAAAALLSAGMAEKAQSLLDLGASLPAAGLAAGPASPSASFSASPSASLSESPWGRAVLELSDQVAKERGDRAGRLQARQALLRRARGAERAEALEALLEILAPHDSDAAAVLEEAWQAQARPRSAFVAARFIEALAEAQRQDALAELLANLVDEPLAPPASREDRQQWALRAAELFRQLGKSSRAAELSERAFRDAVGSPQELRHLLGRQLPPEIRAKVLWELAVPAAPDERALLLLERARLAEQKLDPEEAAQAWADVLREGPGGPGYLQALERRLTSSLSEGRYEDAAAALAAQAEVVEGGHERAQLLEKAAQIRESQLSDMDGALELYRRAAAESGDVHWFATLAEAYDRAGRTAEAAAALGVEVARREPGERRREQQRKLGLMLARELGRPADALPHLRAVALVDAQEGVDDPGLLQALAESARATGDAESERMALSRLPRSSDRAEAQRNLLRQAELLLGLGRAAEAAELWNGMLEADPGNRAAFEPLSLQLRERKAWRDLAELLGRHAAASDAAAADRAQLLVERGSILEGQLDDPAAAERSYREALALNPIQPTALGALRRLVDARGDEGELADLLAAQIASSTLAEAAPLALHLGELQLRLGSPEKAAENLRRALAGAERAPMLLARVRLPLAQAELQMGNALEALAQSEAALSAPSPETHAALALAGQAALVLGERLRALGHFRELLNRHPGDPAALEGLAALSRDQSDNIAAEALSQRIAHHADPAGKARALRELAALREAQNDPTGAEAPLRESVRLDPDDDDGFARLRQILETEGRFKELADALRERARGTADEVVRAASLAEQGDLLRTHLHDPAGAAEAYQRSLEILPRASTSEGYAETLVSLGSDELAAEHYRRALAGGGHLGEFFLLYRLGEIARRLGDKRGALEHFRRAAEANPSFLPAREGMVALAEELGNSELAVEGLRGMAQQLDSREVPEQVAEIELRIAELEKHALHFESARAALAHAAELQPGDARPLERLAALYQNAGRWTEAVRALEQLAARKPGSEAAVPLTAAGEISFDKLADPEQAFGLFARALAAAPGQEAALRRSLEIAAALGKRDRLPELADAVLPGYFSPAGTRIKPTPPWLELLFVPLAQAYEQAGRLEEAQRLLTLARERAPLDLELLQRQSAIAKQTGRLGDEVDLEEELIGRLVEQRPFEAATRLRALARRLIEKTDDRERARRLLERAADLAPARAEDRRLLADLWSQGADAALHERALDAYLDLVRRDPVLDLILLRRIAAGADELDRPELAQMATSLLAALTGAPEGAPPEGAPEAVPTLTPLGPETWSAAPFAAVEGLDRVLRNLAPYFEPLFPARLSHGVTEADRLGPERGGDLLQLVERVRESLGSRPLRAYLSNSQEVSVEATNPPSLIVGDEAGRALGPGGIQWWTAEQIALNELGYTLPAKFSPADVQRLAALVALFLSEGAPVAPAEREQLQAFLAALQRACPESVKAGLLDQAPAAARDLEAFDSRRFVAGAKARAGRLALLLTGDLRAAISVLKYREGAASSELPAWELPSARALIDWAFSDEFLALRRAALGKPASALAPAPA